MVPFFVEHLYLSPRNVNIQTDRYCFGSGDLKTNISVENPTPNFDYPYTFTAHSNVGENAKKRLVSHLIRVIILHFIKFYSNLGNKI